MEGWPPRRSSRGRHGDQARRRVLFVVAVFAGLALSWPAPRGDALRPAPALRRPRCEPRRPLHRDRPICDRLHQPGRDHRSRDARPRGDVRLLARVVGHGLVSPALAADTGVPRGDRARSRDPWARPCTEGDTANDPAEPRRRLRRIRARRGDVHRDAPLLRTPAHPDPLARDRCGRRPRVRRVGGPGWLRPQSSSSSQPSSAGVHGEHTCCSRRRRRSR